VTPVRRGRFITFEGGEGTGKSTQARILAERLAPIVGEVVQTREPGGSPGAEQLRALLLQGEAERWSPVSETLLMYAARADHLERLIRPALERGAWVVCDRFLDSTRAYQGAGGGVSVRLLETLERHVVGETRPELTLILDLPVEQGLGRAFGRNMFDRFEAMDRAFHDELRQGFLDIARAHPDRCAVVDASGDVEAVAARIWTAASERLELTAP
jgi:dTMP kinase